MRFNVGDRVRYELSHFMTPRWFSNRDYGGIGSWEEGTVICVHPDKIEVLGHSGLSIWPLDGHPEYDENQWARPGFIAPLSGDTIEEPQKKKCVCGAHAVYGPDCRLHSSWCDLAVAV